MNRILYQKNAGFTLIETLTALIIAGVLAAIAAPNFFSLLKQNEVNEGITALENALKEAQKMAIRESQQCTVNINTGTNTLTANPTECLPTQRDLDGLTIQANPTTNPLPVTFSYKGNTTAEYTIVISSSGTDNVKCLFIANGLGVMKVGDYTGNLGSPISSTNCVPAD